MLEQLANSLGLGGLSGPPQITHRQRIELALSGFPVDRVPVCFWHHFQPAGNGRQLARATFDFFVTDFDLDIVKVMPDLPYPFPRKSIKSIDDWRLIEPIEQLFGEKLYMHQFKINAKAPFDGELWQWHQDYGVWARDDGMPEPRAMNISGITIGSYFIV